LTLDLAKDKQVDAQTIQDLEEDIAHLQVELTQQADDARSRERELTASVVPSVPIVQINAGHRSRGINSAKHLIGTDSNIYNSWAYSIREKLDTDASMYVNERQRIRYALEQMNDAIFDAIQS
jgi:hypothetical protein